jgi:preprotein translocase subunit SecB
MESSKFQFKGFIVKRSLIEQSGEKTSSDISISFDPHGLVNKNEQTYQLQLGAKIEDQTKTLIIEIDAVANFVFNAEIDESTLKSMFFINAPALLFPYLRAYISSLTALSGLKPITLPTLNLTGLGKELERNTIFE